MGQRPVVPREGQRRVHAILVQDTHRNSAGRATERQGLALSSPLRPLGIVGGCVLGAVNALLIGATLSLVEQAVMQSRRLVFQDITSSFWQYFWDVINLGFVLWLPLLVLQMGSAANPYGPFLVAAVFLLIFILLNPAPEVIYQIRPGSPLEVIRTSYEFVLDNWIEWFLPLAIVVAP